MKYIIGVAKYLTATTIHESVLGIEVPMMSGNFIPEEFQQLIVEMGGSFGPNKKGTDAPGKAFYQSIASEMKTFLTSNLLYLTKEILELEGKHSCQYQNIINILTNPKILKANHQKIPTVGCFQSFFVTLEFCKALKIPIRLTLNRFINSSENTIAVQGSCDIFYGVTDGGVICIQNESLDRESSYLHITAFSYHNEQEAGNYSDTKYTFANEKSFSDFEIKFRAEVDIQYFILSAMALHPHYAFDYFNKQLEEELLKDTFMLDKFTKHKEFGDRHKIGKQSIFSFGKDPIHFQESVMFSIVHCKVSSFDR